MSLIFIRSKWHIIDNSLHTQVFQQQWQNAWEKEAMCRWNEKQTMSDSRLDCWWHTIWTYLVKKKGGKACVFILPWPNFTHSAPCHVISYSLWNQCVLWGGVKLLYTHTHIYIQAPTNTHMMISILQKYWDLQTMSHLDHRYYTASYSEAGRRSLRTQLPLIAH